MISASQAQTFKIIALIAAFSVAAGHYVSTDEVSPGYSYTTNLIFLDAIGNGFFRLAVPAFALASGFFYFLSYKSIADWLPKLRQRIRTIVIPYLIASVIFLAAFCFAHWWFQGTLPAFGPMFLLESLILHPHSVQLWYLRDLMVLVLLAPLFRPTSPWQPVMLPAFGACWLLDINFLPNVAGWHLINLDTLLFFSLGGWLSQRPNLLEKISTLSSSWVIILSALWLALSAWRIAIFPGVTVWYQDGYTLTSLLLFKITLLVGLVILFNAAERMHGNAKLLQLSGYGFFLYLFHFFPLNEVLYRISGRLVEEAYRFWVCGPLAVVITLAMAMLCERWTPTLYRLINGGRAPKKAEVVTAVSATHTGLDTDAEQLAQPVAARK